MRFHSTTWKGPAPITGGGFSNSVVAYVGSIFDQMCSGSTNNVAVSRFALGCVQMICTVAGSTTTAFSMYWVAVVNADMSLSMM